MHSDEYARGPEPGSGVRSAPKPWTPKLSDAQTRQWAAVARAALDDAGARRPGPNPKPAGADESSRVEYAVWWDGQNGEAAGLEPMPDREEAEHTLRRYATWPGRVVSRTVTVGEWQPVEAASNG